MKRLKFIYRLIEISYKFYSVQCIFESVNLDIFDEFKEVVEDHELNSLSLTEHQKKVSLESGADLLKETDQINTYSNKEVTTSDKTTETQIINFSYLSKNELTITNKTNSTDSRNSTHIKPFHIELAHSDPKLNKILLENTSSQETTAQKSNSPCKRKNISTSLDSFSIDAIQSISSDKSVAVKKIKGTKNSEDPIQNKKNNKSFLKFLKDESRNSGTEMQMRPSCVEDQILLIDDKDKRIKPKIKFKKISTELKSQNLPPTYLKTIIVLFPYKKTKKYYLKVRKIIDILEKKTIDTEKSDHKIKKCKICSRYLFFKKKIKLKNKKFDRNGRIEFLENKLELNEGLTDISSINLDKIYILVNTFHLLKDRVVYSSNDVNFIFKKFLCPLNFLFHKQASSNRINILLHNFNQLYLSFSTFYKILNIPTRSCRKKNCRSIKCIEFRNLHLHNSNKMLDKNLSYFGIKITLDNLEEYIKCLDKEKKYSEDYTKIIDNFIIKIDVFIEEMKERFCCISRKNRIYASDFNRFFLDDIKYQIKQKTVLEDLEILIYKSILYFLDRTNVFFKKTLMRNFKNIFLQSLRSKLEEESKKISDSKDFNYKNLDFYFTAMLLIKSHVARYISFIIIDKWIEIRNNYGTDCYLKEIEQFINKHD